MGHMIIAEQMFSVIFVIAGICVYFLLSTFTYIMSFLIFKPKNIHIIE